MVGKLDRKLYRLGDRSVLQDVIENTDVFSGVLSDGLLLHPGKQARVYFVPLERVHKRAAHSS